MNKITLKSALFLMLFGAVFTSCEKEEDSDIPVITLSGDNPLVYETIGQEYVEPGVSTSEGALVVDKTSLYMNKRGESTVYYSAIDDADNVGHASRKVIVKNPSEVMEGTYNVEVIDPSNGNIVDVYIDQITQDDYINGKFAMSNFTAYCQLDKPIYWQYDWNAQTFNLIPDQEIDNSMDVVNNTGGSFPVNFSGNTSFEMEITVAGATNRYSYRKRSDPAPSAYVRFVHISTDSDPTFNNSVDFRVDNTAVAPGIPYLANSNYITTDSGNRSIKVNTSSSCTSILPSTIITNNSDNTNYTFFLVDLYSTPELLKLQDDLSDPPGGQARVRFLHASPGVANVDVMDSTGVVLFSNVAFKNNTTQNLNAGTYKIRMVDPGTSNQIANSNEYYIVLQAGSVYSLYSYLDETTNWANFRIIADK